MAFGIVQGFGGDFAGFLIHDGIPHGGVAVVARELDFGNGDETSARVFQAGTGQFGQVAHDLFLHAVLTGIASLLFFHVVFPNIKAVQKPKHPDSLCLQAA